MSQKRRVDLDNDQDSPQLKRLMMDVDANTSISSNKDGQNFEPSEMQPEGVHFNVCVSCQNKMSVTDELCRRCGSRSEGIVDDHLRIRCPGKDKQCGNQLNYEDKFCTECGFEVDSSLFGATEKLRDNADQSESDTSESDGETEDDLEQENEDESKSSAPEYEKVFGDGKNVHHDGNDSPFSNNNANQHIPDTSEKQMEVSPDMQDPVNEHENPQPTEMRQQMENQERATNVKVFFHALLPDNSKYDQEKEDIYIFFGFSTLVGDWKPHEKYKMGKESHGEFTLIIDIPKDLRDKGFEYKYVFVTKDKAKFKYEHVYFMVAKTKNDKENRRFFMPDQDKKLLGVWHQYDGFIYRSKKESFFEKVHDFFIPSHNEITENTKLAVKHFLPQTEAIISTLKKAGQSKNVTKLLKNVSSVMGCLKFQMIDFSTGFVDDDFFASSFNIILDPLFEELKNCMKQVEKSEVTKHALSVAVFILLIMEKNGLRCLFMNNRELKELFFQSFLLQTDYKKKCVANLVHMKKKFFKMLPLISSSLHELIKRNAEIEPTDSSWLYCVPLLHFLRNDLKPFEMFKPAKHRTEEWWGISFLEDVKEQMKQYTAGFWLSDETRYFIRSHYFSLDWSIPPDKVIADLKVMFEADYLLPRSIMATITMNHLEIAISTGHIPPYISAACLFFHSKSLKAEDSDSKMLFCRLFGKITEQFKTSVDILLSSDTQKKKLQQIIVELQISKDIVMDLVNENNKDELLKPIIALGLSVVNGLVAAHKAQPETVEVIESHSMLEFLHEAALWQLKNEHYFQNNDLFLLQNWADMINLMSDSLLPELKENWQQHLLASFAPDNSTLERWLRDEKLMEQTDSQLKCNDLKEKLMILAFDFFENEMMERPNDKKIPVNKPCGNMMSKMLENRWPKEENYDLQLDFIVSFKPLALCLKSFYGKQNNLLTDKSVECLTKASSLLSDITQKIWQGGICVRTLRKILQKKENILQLMEAAETNFSGSINIHHLRTTLEARAKELDECDRHLKLANTLMIYCKDVNAVNTKELSRDIHEALDKMDQKNLDEFCSPADVKNSENFDIASYKPSVAEFCIPPQLFSEIPKLQNLMKSQIFQAIWKREGANIELADSLESVLIVWKEAKQKWDYLSKDIKSGTITISDILKHISNFSDKYDQIKSEFTLMIDNGSPDFWVEQRLHQLKIISQVDKSQKAAKEIMLIKTQYGFLDDFQPVKKILSLAKNKNEAMNEISASVLETSTLLENVKDEHIESLIAFKESINLIQWLKDSMKDGLKELKVFVDLAYISAGEGDIEIHKVNCLHAAVIGYAPLIFDNNEKCDCITFLKKCKSVWRELQTNPHLPEQLRATAQHLEWLKEISQSHGSVEVTSLSQAVLINSKGIYRVGIFSEQITPLNLDLNCVITLYVTPDDRKERKYSYNQLVDLQSRLMLVAGRAEKGKEEVEQFMMILDSIVRLAKTYIKLVTDGCVLFSCWNAEFFCDKTRYVSVILKFGTQGEQLRSHRQNDQLANIITHLANKFEEIHLEWIQYLNKKRFQYLELNFFTVNQLVFLQQEIVKIGTGSEPSNLMYALLSLIKPKCSKEDILQAVKIAKNEIFHVQKTDISELDHMEDTMPEIQEKKLQFIQAIVEGGFTQKLAEIAYENVENADVDDGLVWCLEHSEDEEIQSSAVDSSNMISDPQEERFSGWTSDECSISLKAASFVQNLPDRFINDTSKLSLIRNITKIWEDFLGSASSSFSDCLSIEHLGCVLQKLALSCDQALDRKLPIQLKPEIPNLLVCPKNDILNAVLHIYKEDPSEPLPRPDEVLLCTSETTFDEVDIFLRRAFFNCLGKIHCLAYADLLPYEIEEQIERKLNDYTAKVIDKGYIYKLVILCSSENEFRARLVAALESYRCQFPVIRRTHIKDYLREKFKSINMQKKIKSASRVDFGQSTVRVVRSKRAGVGKTLYKNRRVQDLRQLNHKAQYNNPSVSLSLYGKQAQMTEVANKLLSFTLNPGKVFPRIFHFNISSEVQEGLDYVLFNLLILGKVTNEKGHVWLRSEMDLYLIEIIPISDVRDPNKTHLIHSMLEVLPHVTCWSPTDTLLILKNKNRPDEYESHDLLFDEEEFQSEVFQRPYQYLSCLESNSSLSDIDPSTPQGNEEQCLDLLLRHCGVPDPSWAEIHHFVWFLNTQLTDFEHSAFCSSLLHDDLPGFSQFVLRFLIQMSRDFATRSLNMSEETPTEETDPQTFESDLFSQFQMRRTWECSPHPYIFFNPDGHSMTFLGFNIDRMTGNLVDQQTGEVLEEGIMPTNLQDSLMRNKVPLNENFDQLQRVQRLEKLCSVMPGLDYCHDPDETYELTTDNVKKILAIFMRFRCNIPVLIMGETGCGKTRLVKFLCSLQCPPGVEVQNMVIMKVHGGTTAEDIIKKVHKAENLAKDNEKINKHMYTVLFFDEANTTEAIGLIKEIMCDGTVDGQPLKLSKKLKIVAACNPYRKHSDELIERLEKAGLGYHVDAEKTTDKLGHVPMRRLVYRVQPLPQSMLPLVWDFGQLNTRIEELYIKQMVKQYVDKRMLPSVYGLVEVISSVLIQSQSFMRNQQDECSFVSLRDVERALKVMSWFYEQSQKDRILFKLMEADNKDNEEDRNIEMYDSEEEEEEATNAYLSTDSDSDMNYEEMLEEETKVSVLPSLSPGHGLQEDAATGSYSRWPDDLTKSFILALGVCYRASLRKREEYDQCVTQFFQNPCSLPGGVNQFVDVITRCQDIFLENVQLDDNIARNQALKENLFMMIICIELRIPLFLVGKPGSSKSLAKTIVSDAMQGNSARAELFRQLKQAQMVSFQCSPLSIAEGILATFRQCSQFQKDKDLDRYVSVVVLDEVGLAEDSVRMPLKTLHPLLEDGCQGDETPEPHNKVAFIGISNWALDPAKMNRGILVQREVPDERELIESAEGICASDPGVLQKIKLLLPQLAEAYQEVFGENVSKREFFGLRDFYSLVKMVCAFAANQSRPVCWHQLEYAVLRNFGGLDSMDPVKFFKKKITAVQKWEAEHPDDPNSTTAGLIEAAVFGDGTDSESRYLLLLTENYGALGILQQILAERKIITIFGSSFPKDQEYTQICRNINRIKVCMETGNTVILLNLENLYESLYDALNQYYARLGGERFVDLGLGTHRVKCRVHQGFRLIVVAEKQTVYEKFPIPLINRLEKHFLRLDSLMTDEQAHFANELDRWANHFVTCYKTGFQREETVNVADAFMGYHPDTAAAIVLHKWQERRSNIDFLESCKNMLLWCATPDSVVRLQKTRLFLEAEQILNTYFKEQHHDDLITYMKYRWQQPRKSALFAQVTTHSKLLTDQDKDEIMTSLDLRKSNTILLTLQSFDTEQQFSQQIKNFINRYNDGYKLMLIQCGSGDKNMSLIKGAQYCVLDELPEDDAMFAVFFIVQLPRIAGGCFTGYMAGKWHSLHIDDLRPRGDLPPVHELYNCTPTSVLQGQVSKHFPNRVTPHDTNLPSFDTESQHEEIDTTEKSVESESMDVAVIELENIILDDGNLENTGQAGTLFPPFLHSLIQRCIHSAAALVKGDIQDTGRCTKRIEILLHFLEDPSLREDELSFKIGLSKMILRLLTEKEEKSDNFAAGWLHMEAARSNNVKKAGTFRRACVQCLENKIVTVLAGVIAFLDMNRNLDILENKPDDHWAHILWLRILHDPAACRLHYDDLLSPGTGQELSEVIPCNTGVHGMPFTVELPFSWLLEELIDNNLASAEDMFLQENENVAECSLLVFVRDLILKSPYGTILNAVFEMGINKTEIIQAYVKDFVHTKYLCSNPFKHEILCEALEISSRQANMDINNLDLISALTAVHCTHSLIRSRLQIFQDVEQVWPDILKAVNEVRETKGSVLLSADELTLDILSLILLLEQLHLQKDQLNNENSRVEWLEKVKTFSPLIQRLFGNNDIANNRVLTYGPVCKSHLERARYLWTRIMTVKLLLESFSAKENKVAEHLIERTMTLWQLLGEKADLKKIESLEKIEKFLKIVNKTVFNKLKEKRGSCSKCSCSFEAPPIVLPCNSRLCTTCFNDLLVFQDKHCKRCPSEITKEQLNTDSLTAEEKVLSAEFQYYQKCCNTFLMAVVSNLCFGGDTAPDYSVIERIFSYVTRKTTSQGEGDTSILQTKQMTIFDDFVDATPVVRSFLLKLLIHKSGDHVRRHLEEFLKETKELCFQQTQQSSGILQFSLMIIQCLEDHLHESAALENAENEMKMAAESLIYAVQHIEIPSINMDKMQAIAHARFGLMTLAKYLHMLVIKNSITDSSAFSEMLTQAKNLIEIENFHWPKKFVLKQICREFGTDSYSRICQWGEIPWIVAEEQSELVKECADRFLVSSVDYQNIRNAVTETLLGDDMTDLETVLDEIESPLKEMYLFLAIHREITMKYIQPSNQHDEFMNEVVAKFSRVSEITKPMRNINLQQILQNDFGQQTDLLNIKPNQSLKDQSILCMVFHFSLVLRNCDEKINFLYPLFVMATDPVNFTDKLMPTMPQDDVKQIKEIIKDGVAYRCPNNHAYFITECGRPYTEGKCSECGSRIGGTNHQPFPGNVKDTGIDHTKTGHILGDASQRPSISLPERKLSGQTCAILRLLTHAALLLGSDVNPQAVASVVEPSVQNVSRFFWEHIEKDIEQLQKGLGKSEDDVFLMLHFIFHQICDKTPGVTSPEHPVTLSSKEERESWEETFASTFICPVLQDLDNLLQKLNEEMAKDGRVGQKLLNILCEAETKADFQITEKLHDIPHVWRYRSRITLNHFLCEFQLQMENSQRKHCNPVLKLFQSESYHLQAMRYIPSILTLQRSLILKFRTRLDRAAAYQMTITDILTTENLGFNMEELFNDFVSAWECVKEKLMDYGCHIHGGLIRVPQEYRNVKITPDFPFAILLPSTTGPGLCSYILLEFLLRKHNEFLDQYWTVINHREHTSIEVKDLKANHIICYHPDKDLLPLILANCNYSFKLGEGTKVEYDFDGFEYQLKEIFFQAKSKVHQEKGIIPLETMLYHADRSNAVVFEALRNKVKQDALRHSDRLHISRDLHGSLPDICDSIENLNIAVCFLKSLADNNDTHSLQQFMTEMLKMKQTILSQKAREVCRIKHVQSLWLLLNLEKSQILAAHNQDAFDNLEPDMKQLLTDEQKKELVEFCQKLTLNKLECFLQEIFDCILLRIAPAQIQTDEDVPDLKEISLRDIMSGDISSPLYTLDSEDTFLSSRDICYFPNTIRGSQATSAWLTVYKEMEAKRQQALY